MTQVRSSGIRCAGMLGQLARKSDTCSKSLWRSSWSDVQPSACACLLSFLEVADFAPKVKWNTCSAVQRLLQWGAWDEHTMCVFVVTRAFGLLFRMQFGFPQLKFIADCILPVFSAPLSHPTPTSRSPISLSQPFRCHITIFVHLRL